MHQYRFNGKALPFGGLLTGPASIRLQPFAHSGCTFSYQAPPVFILFAFQAQRFFFLSILVVFHNHKFFGLTMAIL